MLRLHAPLCKERPREQQHVTQPLPCTVCLPQACSAALMLLCGGWVEAQLEAGNAGGVTSLFFLLVLLAATQDIAVDGWALTLLSKQHVG